MVEELGNAGQTILVRVNDFETELTWADLDAVVCSQLYAVMLPKVTGPEDVKRADTIIEFLERKNGIEHGTVLIYPVLETAQGMRQAYEVAIASPRVVHMGGLTGKDGDIARAIGFQWTPEGHEAFYYISKVLLDARAANIPYPMGGRGWWDIQDLDGLRAEAVRTRNFGYTGMLLIHPSHVSIVNDTFTPSRRGDRALARTNRRSRAMRARGTIGGDLQRNDGRHGSRQGRARHAQMGDGVGRGVTGGTRPACAASCRRGAL